MSAPSLTSNPAALPAVDGLAKRNALVLACAQALGGANPAIVVSLGGLVGQVLAENKELATLPVSLTNLGLALGTIPAAMLMRRIGRRGGFSSEPRSASSPAALQPSASPPPVS
jgi:hypothetical protein